MYVKNKDILISHGDMKKRKIAIDMLEHALISVNSYDGVKKITKIIDNVLCIGILRIDLSEINNIFVFGAGKATMGQARALDEVLGNKIEKGIVIVKKGQGISLKNIEVKEGGHPRPDEDSFRGARMILDAVKTIVDKDLVFYCDSGGSSALMSHPALGSGIRFVDEIKVTHMLLMSGAPIYEINAVRRHVTAMKGGRLQELVLSRGAQVINFKIPDTPEIIPEPDDISIPFKGGWEDQTTFEDAIRVLKSYELWDKTPTSVREHIKKGLTGVVPETPKDFRDMKVLTFYLGTISIACEAASKRAEELGYKPMICTTVLEGESRDAGLVLASLALEVEGFHRPIEPPCALIFGGETTVTIEGTHGEGGPSQELALGFAQKIAGKKIVCLTMDTDGTDGPTDIAGALVDGYTVERAKNRGLNVLESLRNHDSSAVLRQLGDTVITGPTDTNVCDINIIIIDE